MEEVSSKELRGGPASIRGVSAEQRVGSIQQGIESLRNAWLAFAVLLEVSSKELRDLSPGQHLLLFHQRSIQQGIESLCYNKASSTNFYPEVSSKELRAIV